MRINVGSTNSEKLTFILEALYQDLLPRVERLERLLDVHDDHFKDVHGVIEWLEGNLRIEYPEWYSERPDQPEEE